MRLTKLSLACLVLGGSALLTACGGGDSVTAGSALTLRGTAALGKALVGPVSASCKTGTGTATSNLDGSYTVVVSNGVGPCLLSITANGVTLYSVTSGTGSALTGNITPMTNALVNYLLSVPGMNSATTQAGWFALPATQALLVDTAALTTRITRDFIPAMKTLLPSLTLLTANFLATAFTTDGIDSTDADLDKLTKAGIVTSTGAPSAATATALQTSASKSPAVVAPPSATGATGATGASS